jgi:hypothetical protein
MTSSIKNIVPWDVTPYSLVEVYRLLDVTPFATCALLFYD